MVLNPRCIKAGSVWLAGLLVLLGAFAALGQSAATSRAVNPRLEAVRRKAAVRKLEQEITTAWHRSIEGLLRTHLGRADPTARAEGRKRLAAIRDPLALGPLIRILGASERVHIRAALAEHLGRFTRDEAAAQLSVMCLTDPATAVRTQATAQLGHQDDPRVIEVLRGALRSRHEAFVIHAAESLRQLNRLDAADALIGALVSVRSRNGGTIKAATAFLEMWQKAWTPSVRPQLAPGAAIPTDSALRQVRRWLHPAVRSSVDPMVVEPSVFRTAVLEALRALTKEDFGFDQRRWRQWWNRERLRRKLLPKLKE